MAVLLMAITLESTSTPGQCNSQTPGSQKVTANQHRPATAMVHSTCNRPRPNTYARMDLSLARLNSKPITNIKNTTPNSAKWRMPVEF